MTDENDQDKDVDKDGFPATDEEILEEAREDYKRCVEAEKDNREAALDDLEFARLGKQWPDEVKDKRTAEQRPCMTFNRMPTFIRQVVNDARQNKPAIKVHPADDKADPATAQVVNDLIRNIEYSSNAEVAYDNGIDFAASCGVGYWRVDLEYACEDVFDLDIEIQPIYNPFSVYRDWASTSADSADWNRAFVVDSMEKDAFETKYKGKEKVDWDGETYQKMPGDWMDGEKVIVAEYWRRREVPRTILLLSDGRVVSQEWFDDTVEGAEAIYPEAGPLTNGQLLAVENVRVVDQRDTRGYKVMQYIVNGVEVLEKNEWAGKYIPIVPVFGEMVNVEGKLHLKSLIRDAKDAQRNFNYWRTTTTELIALAPKMPFIGAAGQFATDADKWARANTDSIPYVEYDMVMDPTSQVPAPPPQRQPFAGVPAGALQEALNASDDMKTIIGIFDASLGARSNETSGRAINARKSEADTGTFHFIDNQARAIRHTGRIILDLIPKTYNKARIIRVMGIDKQPQNVPINRPLQPGEVPKNMLQQGEEGIPQIFDLKVGKYDLTVDVGPGYQTKREEAAYGMTELLRAFPASATIIGPRLAKAQDWPGAEEIAKEWQAMSGNAPNPQVQQLQQQMQQLNQQAQQAVGTLQEQLQQAKQQLVTAQSKAEYERKKLEIEEYQALTDRIEALTKAAGAGNLLAQQALAQMAQSSPELFQMPPPTATQIQPQPGQPPGFFSPGAGQQGNPDMPPTQ